MKLLSVAIVLALVGLAGAGAYTDLHAGAPAPTAAAVQAPGATAASPAGTSGIPADADAPAAVPEEFRVLSPAEAEAMGIDLTSAVPVEMGGEVDWLVDRDLFPEEPPAIILDVLGQSGDLALYLYCYSLGGGPACGAVIFPAWLAACAHLFWASWLFAICSSVY